MHNQKTVIELVPKDEEYLRNRIHQLRWNIDFDWINLPHLKAKDNWDVTFMTPEDLTNLHNILPDEEKLILHLRTQDSQTPIAAVDRVKSLLKWRANEVLLISWDTFNNTESEIITTWNTLNWGMVIPRNVSVSADLYVWDNWWRFPEKLDFLRKNPHTNIYTQPIFWIEIIQDVLDRIRDLWLGHTNEKLYAWITWTPTLKSRDYWRDVNFVPENHLPKWETDQTIKENSISIAGEIMKEVINKWLSVYIMLMRWKIEDLVKIQNKASNLTEL